eukprot:366028-Chlamydomonas_euryale.AAC.43
MRSWESEHRLLSARTPTLAPEARKVSTGTRLAAIPRRRFSGAEHCYRVATVFSPPIFDKCVK